MASAPVPTRARARRRVRVVVLLEYYSTNCMLLDLDLGLCI